MMTYTDLKNMFLDATQNTGSTDTNLLTFFKRQLDQRYQFVLAELQNYITQVQRTATTVASQPFYHNPVGIVNIETATVTVGSIAYPLITVHSQLEWDYINQTLIAATVIPVFIFPRRDDFGIWPTPQAAYTITLNYSMRDKKMQNDDYSTGNLTATNNSATITGSGTTWTSAMIGRWLFAPDGYWYRIFNVNSTTSITLETTYEGTTTAGSSYTIGETPDLPEEAHALLAYGAIAEFFFLVRSDIAKGTAFNNLFWTGDSQNSDREGENVRGGLIGIAKRYATRSNTAVVYHKGGSTNNTNRIWGQTIST